MALAGLNATRTSVSGEPRSAVCGMGICQECRAQVNGRIRLACQTLCVPGMVVESLK
jgi:succinate dehydrogenase/fumarate reductase-like Fe-S protein